MRALIQRVKEASVSIDGNVVSCIGQGALILLGVANGDNEHDLRFLAGKVSRLRIYDDADGLLNASIDSFDGAFLVVSQFTLYGNCAKGNRPSYIDAAPPEEAERMYLKFVKELRNLGHKVQTGVFAANMQVALINDGPVTLMLESHGRGG